MKYNCEKGYICGEVGLTLKRFIIRSNLRMKSSNEKIRDLNDEKERILVQ